MEEVVFLNGKFLKASGAKLSVFAPGFLLGYGLFESMRSHHGKIVYLDEHLSRMQSSAKLIAIRFPLSFMKLKNIIKETVEKNRFKDAYVRLTLWRLERGTGILIAVKKYQPYSYQKYRRGFRAVISTLRQNEDSLLARIKSTNRIFYHLSLQAAQKKGFDEAIILNNRGYITEATRSNLFLVKGKELFTPALSCGCLAGITRKVIFGLAKKNNLKIYEGNFTLEDLDEADEAFLTNSLMGVMPLVCVEKQTIGKGLCGKLSRYFMKEYNSLLR